MNTKHKQHELDHDREVNYNCHNTMVTLVVTQINFCPYFQLY